jgi:hypothetical protein
MKQLRPGDLVIYFPDATHVAMYVGDGKVVQAPRAGESIKISPVAANPVLGAVRPDATPTATSPAGPGAANLGARGTARAATTHPQSPATPHPNGD